MKWFGIEWRSLKAVLKPLVINGFSLIIWIMIIDWITLNWKGGSFKIFNFFIAKRALWILYIDNQMEPIASWVKLQSLMFFFSHFILSFLVVFPISNIISLDWIISWLGVHHQVCFTVKPVTLPWLLSSTWGFLYIWMFYFSM